MPFFIQQPTTHELPRTKMELVEPGTAQDQPQNRLDILQLDRDLIEDAFLRGKYYSLKQAWENNTMFSSSLSKITEDVNFKRIVEMGNKAIPLIIEDIDKKPSSLVWALNLITRTTLSSKMRVTITDACKAWVKIYRRGGIKL